MSKTIEEVRYKLQDLDCGHDECIMASYSDGRKDAIQEMNKRIDERISHIKRKIEVYKVTNPSEISNHIIAVLEIEIEELKFLKGE